MAFKQPDLPYDLKALAPFVSEEQMHYHFNKHHAAYFKKLNGLVEGKPESDLDLEQVVKQSSGGMFNNAAQAWNHTFFWDCMSPNGGGNPSGDLMSAIERDFGSLDEFMKKFSNAAATLFGSGWAWLATDGQGKLEIMTTPNQDSPISQGLTPVLGIDVWEHAYYLTYQNRRPDYVEAFFKIINWDMVNQHLEKAR